MGVEDKVFALLEILLDEWEARHKHFNKQMSRLMIELKEGFKRNK